MPRTAKMVKVSQDLLGARHVLSCTLNLHRIRFQLDVHLQALFQHLQVLVTGAEKLLNVTNDFYVFFHSTFAGVFLKRARAVSTRHIQPWSKGSAELLYGWRSRSDDPPERGGS